MKNQTPLDTAPPSPIEQRSSNSSIDTATLELLAGWRNEDATDDPEAVRAAEQELAEFKKVLNENCTGRVFGDERSRFLR